MMVEARGVRVDSSTFTFETSSEKWSLDALGNWVSRESNPTTGGSYQDEELREHNLANELIARDTDGDSTDDVTLSYDAAGNIRTLDDGVNTTTYTHDGWNRLVKVEVGATVYGEYQYNGLHWRTLRRAIEGITPGVPTFNRQRIYSYSLEWQILEEWADDDFNDEIEAWTESFWGVRGTDDIIKRRINSNLENDDPEVTYEKKFHHLTDPSFSTVAVLSESGAIQERVRWDAFGKARHRRWNDVNGDGDYDSADRQVILSLAMVASSVIGHSSYNVDCDLDFDGDVDLADLSLAGTSYQPALPGGSISLSEIANQYGYTGALHSPESDLSLFRNRWYSAVLGRWVERDPAGYVDGLNLYLYVGGNPILLIDPMGLMGGYRSINSEQHERRQAGRQTAGIQRAATTAAEFLPGMGVVDGLRQFAAGNWGWGLLMFASEVPVGKPLKAVKLAAGAAEAASDAARATTRAADTPGGAAKAAGRTSHDTARLAGEVHHPISKKVHDALEQHPNLKGRYTNRDPRFETRAIDPGSHKGYQRWHRDLDDEVVKWINDNPNATPEEFEQYLRGRYSQPDLRDRFPDGVCENPINLH